MYRDMRYAVDLRHPLQAPCGSMGRQLSSRRGRRNVENPEGISKECGKGGKPASRLSMLSTLCHFHGLLFARQMQDKPICRRSVQCGHSPRSVHGYSSLVNECIGDLSSAKRNQPTSFRKTNLPRNRLQIRQELQSLSALYSGTLDLTHERCNIYAEHSLRPTFI